VLGVNDPRRLNGLAHRPERQRGGSRRTSLGCRSCSAHRRGRKQIRLFTGDRTNGAPAEHRWI